MNGLQLAERIALRGVLYLAAAVCAFGTLHSMLRNVDSPASAIGFVICVGFLAVSSKGGSALQAEPEILPMVEPVAPSLPRSRSVRA